MRLVRCHLMKIWVLPWLVLFSTVVTNALWECVLSAGYCLNALLLCFLFVGIWWYASEISIPLTPLMMQGWIFMWITSLLSPAFVTIRVMFNECNLNLILKWVEVYSCRTLQESPNTVNLWRNILSIKHTNHSC